MPEHPIASREAWLAARRALLEKEKAHSRARDALTAARQALPWVKVEKDYRFRGPDGEEGLADLFAGRGQLIVYHFMFQPDWEAGCKSCSLLADHYAPAIPHLAARDVTMVTVSAAPLETLEAFRRRMGWNFKWVSSEGSDFNRDFQVQFSDAEIEAGEVDYNYRPGGTFPCNEAPGISSFARGDDGAVYHHYSAYSRGLERFITAYTLLDIVPKGRDEEGLDFTMEWVRLHDEYDAA